MTSYLEGQGDPGQTGHSKKEATNNGKRREKNVWFVIQNSTYETDKAMGRIRSWKAPNRELESRSRTSQVRKGDHIIHYVNGFIVAVGQATSDAFGRSASDQKVGQGSTKLDSWEADVEYKPLAEAIRFPQDRFTNTSRVKARPTDVNGKVKQGYLFESHDEINRWLDALLAESPSKLARKFRLPLPKRQLEAPPVSEYVYCGDRPQDRKEARKTAPDKELLDSANRAHDQLQDHLATLTEDAGNIILTAANSDTEVDLLWQREKSSAHDLFIAEVKSLTAKNEMAQLRKGLGQVLQYRELYRRARPKGWEYRDVHAVLAVEFQPSDLDLWKRICDSTAVSLWWPGQPCLLYTSPSPRDRTRSRMPSSA